MTGVMVVLQAGFWFCILGYALSAAIVWWRTYSGQELFIKLHRILMWISWVFHGGLNLYGLALFPPHPENYLVASISLLVWVGTGPFVMFHQRLALARSYRWVLLGAPVMMTMALLIVVNHLPSVEWLEEGAWFRQSILLVHVIALIAGNILFGMACFSSVLYLYQEHQIKNKIVRLLMDRFPSLGTLERVSFQATVLGFIFLSVGVVFGFYLGGGFESQQVSLRLGLSIGIWVMYGVFLLERIWQGYWRRLTAIWSIIGFVLVMVSFLVEIIHLNSQIRI